MEYTTCSSDYRAIARDRLSGKWVIAMLTFFVAGLLGGGTDVSIDIDSETLKDIQTLFPGIGEFLQEILPVLTAILAPLAIWSVVCFVIGGAIELGLKKFSLDIADNKEVSIEILFSQIRRIGGGIALRLLTSLFVTLWTMLFIIPGIMKAYSYALAPYIMAEDSDCGALEAITRSKELMKGHRWELFCLQFSFIGWNLLSIFTLGLLNIWITPYMGVAEAVFYRNILREAGYSSPVIDC